MKNAIIIASVVLLLFIPAFNSEPAQAASFGLTPSEAFVSYAFCGNASLSVSARSAILLDAEKMNAFYSKNPSERMGMASTTKIMTALLALDHLSFSSMFYVPKEAVGVEGSSIYLYENELISAEALIYGLMLESGNDAAVAIAYAVSGSVEAFVELMNEKAKELGMLSTHYVNPHGLSDDNHYTTAADLALLTAHALKNETFMKITSTRRAQYTSVTHDFIRYYVNHNKLLTRYNGMVGVKTGYTIKTGKCLVTAAKRNDVFIIAVTLNAPDDKNDHIKMLDYGFSLLNRKTLAVPNEFEYEISVVGSTVKSITVSNTAGLVISMPADIKLEASLILEPFMYAPVEKNTYAGEIRWCAEGNIVAVLPLYTQADAKRQKLNLIEKFFEVMNWN